MTVRVPVVVDYDPRKMKQAQGDLGDLEEKSKGRLAGLKSSALGAAAGIAGVTVAAGLAAKGIGDAIKAAQESEASNVRLQQALKATGVDYEKNADQIEKAVQATSKLAAVDDEDLQDAFSRMVRKTGDVNKSLEGMELAANIARGRNIDLAAASKAVEMAMQGKTAALKKLTGDLPTYTGNMDAAKVKIEEMEKAAGGKLTPALKEQADALKAAAKEADANATKTSILEAAQKKFAGAAEEYGKTAKGAQERLGVAFENLQEKIGEKLLPIMAKLANKAVELLEWVEAHWPQIQKVIEPVMAAIRAAFEDVIGVIRLIVDIFRGDWSKAWDEAKAIIVRTVIAFAHLYEPLLNAGKALGGKLVDGLAGALSGLKDLIVGGIKSGLNAAIGALEDGINGIVRTYNRTIGKVAGVFGAPRLPELSIPRLAAGGIVTRPTVALIGEAGPEAVIPLGRGRRGGAGRMTVNLTVNAGVGTDGYKVGQAVISALQAWQRMNGPIPIATV